MKTFHLTYPHTLHLETLPETVAAIGFFDGIHKGHQEVIETASKEAKERNMESAVITFHPHPSAVLRPSSEQIKYITPLEEKQRILQNMEIDRLYVINFTEELAALSPREFIKYFITGLHIKHLVAGFDFTFGHKGAGNMDNIGKMAAGKFSFTRINKVEFNDEKVSSTKIRQMFKTGKIHEINNLLGRNHQTKGKVISGAKRGRELGYPTANLHIYPDVLLPSRGIYAVKIFHKNINYLGLVSLGINPTFTPESNELKLEVHLLDFDQDIYGEELTIEWHKFLRKEKKFKSAEELIEAMDQDVKITRKYF